MSFPKDVANNALCDCGRCCCICHKFCGTKLELHHIVQQADEGEDTYENCIPLCFDCHAEVKAYNPKHPKGRKYTETELRSHRDRWYKKVRNSAGLVSNPDYLEVDRETFHKFREILPSTGTIIFLREHDFGNKFEVERLSDLFKFIQQCKNPEFEFFDVDMESLRAKLLGTAQDFNAKCGTYTFPLRIMGWNCVKKENVRTGKLAKNFHKHMNELNDGSTQVCNVYDELIRTGRKKLAVV